MESIGRFSLVGASVVAVIAVVAGCSDAPSTGDAETRDKASSTSTPTSSPTPTPDPVLTSAPTGKWTFTSTVMKVKGDKAGDKVGDTEVATWRFKPACEVASDCGGRIRSSSGALRTYIWDGTTLTVTRVSPKLTSEGWCVDAQGAKIPGTTVAAKIDHTDPLVLTPPDGVTAGQVPTRFVGNSTYSQEYTGHAMCNENRSTIRKTLELEIKLEPGAAPKN